MSIFIYVCVTKFGLDVCECLCSFFFFVSACFSLEFLNQKKRTNPPPQKKTNLVKTFCKNGIVNTALLCYMLFFHGRNCTKMLSNKVFPNQCRVSVLTETPPGVNRQLLSSAECLARAAACFGRGRAQRPRTPALPVQTDGSSGPAARAPLARPGSGTPRHRAPHSSGVFEER